MATTSHRPDGVAERELADSLRDGVEGSGQPVAPGALEAVRRRAGTIRYRRRAAALGALGCLLALALVAPLVAVGRAGSDDAIRVDIADDPVPTTLAPTTTVPQVIDENPTEAVLPQAPSVTTYEDRAGDLLEGEAIAPIQEGWNDAQTAPQDPSLQPAPPLTPGLYLFAEISFDGQTVSLLDLADSWPSTDVADGISGIGSIMLRSNGQLGPGISCIPFSGDGSYTTSTGYLDILDLGSVLLIETCPDGLPPGTNEAMVDAVYELLTAGRLTTWIDGDFVMLRSADVSVLAYRLGPPEKFVLSDDNSLEELTMWANGMRQHVIQLLAARG